MVAGKTVQRLCVLAAIVAHTACGTGEVSESVFSVESFCSFSPRLAIVVEISAPSDVSVDSVTATQGFEQHCYLERAARDDDAGEPGGALYSCLAQGPGKYVVRVKSGKRTWMQDVEVSGDKCQVDELQMLSFDLD